MRFATCNCPVGMKYHALNCPTKPGQPQNLPEWAKPKRREAKVLFDAPEATLWDDGVLRIQEKL